MIEQEEDLVHELHQKVSTEVSKLVDALLAGVESEIQYEVRDRLGESYRFYGKVVWPESVMGKTSEDDDD